MLERLEEMAGAFHVAFINEPDLRSGFHDGQLADAALRICIEHVRFDPSLLEQISDQMSVWQTGGGIELFQVRKISAPEKALSYRDGISEE